MNDHYYTRNPASESRPVGCEYEYRGIRLSFQTDAGVFSDALEMARWAPSATNRQPWRAIVCGDTVHFFEKQTLKESALGDIQKLDVGIALAHFDLTMREDGHAGHFIDANPGFSLPEGTHYIISYERET